MNEVFHFINEHILAFNVRAILCKQLLIQFHTNLFKLCACCWHGLKTCMWFVDNVQIYFDLSVFQDVNYDIICFNAINIHIWVVPCERNYSSCLLKNVHMLSTQPEDANVLRV